MIRKHKGIVSRIKVLAQYVIVAVYLWKARIKPMCVAIIGNAAYKVRIKLRYDVVL